MSESPYQLHGASAGGGPVAQLVQGMSSEDYDSLPYVRNSRLSKMGHSPAHYDLDGKQSTQRETASMSFGTLAHCGILEPAAIHERYVCIPPFENHIDAKKPKATKLYKDQVAEFRESVAPKEAVDVGEMDRMLGVAESVSRHANVFHGGQSEAVLIWQDDETGIWCKARLDYLREDGVYDLKTTRDCRDFSRAIGRYGYDRQAAFYLRGCAALGLPADRFQFVVVETEPPYGICVGPLDEETLADGERQVARFLRRVRECEDNNDWPAVVEESPIFKKPRWAMTKQEAARLTVGGVEVAI